MSGKTDRNGANLRKADLPGTPSAKELKAAKETIAVYEARKRKRRNDIVLVAAIIAVALSVWMLFRPGGPLGNNPVGELAGTSTSYAVVQNTEGEYDALPLSQDARLTVTCSRGVNEIVVQDGSVYVESADCKNQICVNTGKINRIGDTIICLPHQMVVQVVAKPEDASAVQGFLEVKLPE